MADRSVYSSYCYIHPNHQGGAAPPSPPEMEMEMEMEREREEALSSAERQRQRRRRRRRWLHRDVAQGLRDAASDFSFLRLRGLRGLLNSLRSAAASDTSIRLFRHSQSIPHLQVVPVLFDNSLRKSRNDSAVSFDHILCVEPVKLKSPATDSEVALALRVLEGCCLLHKDSAALAHQHDAIKVLLNILSTRGLLEQRACLDALIALMLDSSANKMDFEEYQGIQLISELTKDDQKDDTIRLKCAEFLLLLTEHVYGKEESVHEDIGHLLGEKCASLMRTASQFGSTLDLDQRWTIAIRSQAWRILESLKL